METPASSKQKQRSSGKTARKQVARSDHANWKRSRNGRDALAILRRAAVDRVPELMALKYERMAASPFGYFRGAVPVMAHDLGQQAHTGIFTQLCGDAHVRNLGAFAGPDGRLVFDINDFDETIRGPFEWDVKRMAASIHVAAREAGESEAVCTDTVQVFAHRYCKAMVMFAAMPIVEIARYQIHRGSELKAVNEVFARAERETPVRLRDSLTVAVGAGAGGKAAGKKAAGRTAKDLRVEAGEASAELRRFRPAPPEVVRLAEAEAAAVLKSMTPYLSTIEPERRHLLSRYRAVDLAFKVVGTGSVGLRDYLIYMEGNGAEDPLFLQVKQETASGWAPYLPAAAGGGVDDAVTSQGQRVVRGQRAMQVQSDPFLGWTHMQGHDFLVRQLNDHKGSVNLGTLDAEALEHYADVCGELLARGHARAGHPDELGGYLGRGTPFEEAVTVFAKRYADQTEEDWKALKKRGNDRRSLPSQR